MGAHFSGRSFRQSILALETKCTPAVNVVKNWLVFPLFCVYQLSHTDSALSVVESVKELLLYLFLAIDELRL